MCVCECMCVCVWCVRMCRRPLLQTLSDYACVCVRVFVFVYMWCVCMSMCGYVCVWVCVCVCSCVCVYVYTCCKYMCTCVGICACIYILYHSRVACAQQTPIQHNPNIQSSPTHPHTNTYKYIFMYTYIYRYQLRWGCVFLERTQILSGIQFTKHFIDFFVVTTKRFVGTFVNKNFDKMRCKLDSIENPRSFEKCPTPP